MEHPYRWVIVAAGGLLGCVAMGAMFSLPVFLRPIGEATGWSVTGISAAMTFGFLSMALGSLVWGGLSDRIGARPVVLAGSVILAASLGLASRAPGLGSFQLCFGLLAGAGAGAIIAPMMACVTGWFETRRGLAVSLVSAGMGMAPMTVAPFAAWLVARHDWRFAMLTIAVLAAAVMIPAALLIRRPPPSPRHTHQQDGMSLRQALLSPQFITLMLANFFCCATHSGPIFHTVSYAVTCGIPMIAAVSIYSVEGLAGMFGRIGFGVAGDRFGAWRVLVLGLLAQAFAVLAYVFVSALGGFYAVAALVGFIYAGTMPLYAVIIRDNFPMRMLGTIIGGTSMAGSLGMAGGPLLGGMVYDRLGSYAMMYVFSWGFGLVAVAVLLAFRPFTPASRPSAI